ncbi:hypothetical protein [Burkholderia multivorans]|uniref:hypothetical protein n=1 Tax=Burkholderia TaxID=32008 RepID=UPI00374FB134
MTSNVEAARAMQRQIDKSGHADGAPTANFWRRGIFKFGDGLRRFCEPAANRYAAGVFVVGAIGFEPTTL